MKRLTKCLLIIFMLISLFTLVACDLFNKKGTSSIDDAKEYNSEFKETTGKWYLLDENRNKTNTYFEFDGSLNNMTFKYIENGTIKFIGKYRCVYKVNDGENTYTVNFILTRDNGSKDEWVYTYADDFDTDFTQFTIIKEERNEGMNDGRIYSHIYRISELPYKLGTYVLDGKEYKQEKDNYKYANYYQVPEGTYYLNENVSITFIMPKPYSYALFEYKNGNETVEGVYWTANDKKTIYLYIEHDPYQYIRLEDRNNYDMTFSHDYPPDFYLRGNFEVMNNSIVINSLYHHDYSPTKIEDKIFKFGTYTK